MKKYLAGFLALFTTAILLAGCQQNTTTTKAQKSTVELNVSAAASLKDALGDVQKAYAKKHPEVKLTFNLGSSGTLQQQIEQGAPTDLFISAGKKQMDALETKGLLLEKSKVNLLGNELVVVVSKDNNKAKAMSDLAKTDINKIGIGTPETVPAGKYAQDSLIAAKLWTTLQPKFVQAKDVREVLTYVETGNAEAGFVYKSDAQISSKVKIAFAVPANLHKPIVYPAAIIKASKKINATKDFRKFLQSDQAMKIFVKYGFTVAGK